MKELTNYINEKLKVDDIVPDKEEFPIDKDSKKIIEFLKAQGFKELDDNKIHDWSKYFIEMDKMSTKVYSLTPADDDDNVDSLKFANTTKVRIGNNNPLFLIMHDLTTKEFKYQLCYSHWGYEDVSKKVFLEKINQDKIRYF